MGALHAGHARLLETAREDCDCVVVSIFVNPLQFGPNEDYARYPQALSSDLELCRDRGADVVFTPAVEDMYPGAQLTFVEVTKLSDRLCGYFRRGHFRGVTTVVLKLLNTIQPDRAYFGEKDFQQLVIIRRMVRDLALSVDVRGVTTVREDDGLAMSSRNQYLDPPQRAAATVIHRALAMARQMANSGTTDAKAIKDAACELIGREPLAQVQYFELVNEDLEPVVAVSQGTYAACAVFFGTTRLIDNIRCL
jgi:pantoate--beta-alanine ligase